VLAFIILLHLGYFDWAWIFFSFSPIVIIAMVYNVIRHGKYTCRELKEGEEWGYEDWIKE